MRNGLKPTVAQLVHSLNVGGAELLAARIAQQLEEAYRFVFFCLDDRGPLEQSLRDQGFAVEFLDRRPGVDWRCSARLGRLLARHRVDIIHAHQYAPFFYGLTSRFLYPRPGVLFTEHGRAFPDYPRRKRMAANRFLLQERDRIVGVGEAVRRALVDFEGIPARRVEVIRNGTNLGPFRNGVPVREAIRRELELAASDLVIIHVARLDPVKDHATALAALAELLPRRPEARLLIVGDGPERPNLERMVRERGLCFQVRLLGLRSDVPRLIKAADIGLLTSRSEGIPLTLLEAMAAGLPVVATDVGGVPEVVVHGETGLLAAAGDVSAVARHLEALAAQPDRRCRLGRAGRNRAETEFSEEKMLKAYDRLYQEMLVR